MLIHIYLDIVFQYFNFLMSRCSEKETIFPIIARGSHKSIQQFM